MNYYFNKTVSMPFQAAVAKTREELGKEGFGVLTEIDIRATMKKKLDVDVADYMILGACNPPLAYRALEAENKIGTMLPCNVIVRDAGEGNVEIAAIDPVASMSAVDNQELIGVAMEVREKLQRVVEAI